MYKRQVLGPGFDPDDIRAVIAGERPIPELPKDSQMCIRDRLRFMLGQIFFAVPGRLIAIEHGPSFCKSHRSAHELYRL